MSPLYTWIDQDSGEKVELHLSHARYEEVYDARGEDGIDHLEGRRLKRDLPSDLTKRRVADIWPLPSDSIGVDPSQIPEAMARDRKMGVPTEYTPQGDAIWRSEGHRRSYIKAMEYQDTRGYH